MTLSIRSRWVRLGLAVAALTIVAVVFVYAQFFREPAPARFDSADDDFLFGSVGDGSLRRRTVMGLAGTAEIFPDLLPGPGGYAALGIQSKEGYEMPIGLSRATVGYPRVGMNCALCHTPGRPPDDAAARRYVSFLASAAADPRFTPGAILGEIAKNYRLSATDRLLYRFVIIPGTRGDLLAWQGRREVWDHSRPPAVQPSSGQGATWESRRVEGLRNQGPGLRSES